MSFLAELNAKKEKLKPTQTTVTHVDGSRIVENKDEIREISAQQYGFIVDNKPDTVAACILDNFLYLGSQDSVNSENIQTHQLTHILSIGIEMPTTLTDPVSSISNIFIPCLDLPDEKFSDVMDKSISFIKHCKQQNGAVLIHCNAGVSRSASIAIAYLIREMEMNFTDAFSLVKSKRQCIRPNDGFMMELKKL